MEVQHYQHGVQILKHERTLSIDRLVTDKDRLGEVKKQWVGMIWVLFFFVTLGDAPVAALAAAATMVMEIWNLF